MWFLREKKTEVPKGPALACLHYGVCSEKKCPLWIEYDKQNADGTFQHKPVGKCTLAWTPELLIELRNSLTAALKAKEPGNGGLK